MSTATVTETPATTAAPATPELPDWLDGATEVLLPTGKHLRAYWDADILDMCRRFYASHRSGGSAQSLWRL